MMSLEERVGRLEATVEQILARLDSIENRLGNVENRMRCSIGSIRLVALFVFFIREAGL